MVGIINRKRASRGASVAATWDYGAGPRPEAQKSDAASAKYQIQG
jgi:hypothetical protein